MNKTLLCTLAIAISLGTASNAFAEKKQWPLDIDISQSSSFAEFRGMRFHAGIDLRTKQTNGFPVYAIEDGFVSRASVQFTGYGYGIYIDHPKLGARVVYGHMKSFEGPLQKYVSKKLAEKKSRHGFQEFFTANRFPVKKGQIVGYSGESGSGPSHLHFEMRNFKDEPLAPCKFGYRPADNIYPNIHYFYVEPMEYGAVIDGSFLGQKYSCKKTSKEQYNLIGTPTTFGKVGCQIGVSDTNGIGNKFGVESVSFSLNGENLLTRGFYEYSYDTNRHCPFVYDYFKSNMSGTGYVYNLFKWPFENLPFSSDFGPWSGVIDNNSFPEKEAAFDISITDYGDNMVMIYGNLAKTNYNFTNVFSEEEVGNYLLLNIVPGTFGTVVVCKNSLFSPKSSSKDALVRKAGLVEIKDSKGITHKVPCLKDDKSLELAFKPDKCWEGGAWMGKTQVLPLSTYISPEGGKIADTGIEIEFKKDTVHFPVMAMLRNVNSKPAPEGDNRQGYLQPYSSVWRFDPSEIVFDNEAKVKMAPVNYKEDLKKLGIYNVDNHGKYSHNGESLEKGLLTFTTRTGGRYVILEDSVPPMFKYARHFNHYQLGKVYAFKGYDLGKGVSWLSGKATINGTSVETYADPDKKEIYVIVPSTLKKPHKVTLTASDNAGNSSTATATINR